MIVLLLLGKIAWINFIKTAELLPKIATRNLKNILAQIWTILLSNYTVLIKLFHPKVELNKLLENCLKRLWMGRCIRLYIVEFKELWKTSAFCVKLINLPCTLFSTFFPNGNSDFVLLKKHSNCEYVCTLCCIYLCSLVCLRSKMPMFQWAGMREGGEPLVGMPVFQPFYEMKLKTSKFKVLAFWSQ